jgi:hypothetical protein
MRTKCHVTKFESGAAALFAGKEAMNVTLMIASTVRGFAVMFLLCVLFLMQADAQPRISLHIQRLDFNGNLLKFADGTFIAERQGELYRLTADGKFSQKLDFDPTQPIPEIIAYNTYFNQLLAPLADGGFFASLEIEIPLLGSVERLARFDRDGRLISVDRSDTPFDESYSPVAVGVQLSDGRVLIGPNLAEDDFRHRAFGLWGIGSFQWFPFGSTRALALQGSNVVAAGDFSFSQSPTQTVALLRLNPDLSLDSSFRPPLCKDVSQLAVQSDGRIIARGRLADAQGVFDSETSVFRLNPGGSFERRLLQSLPDEWQTPAFGIETNGDIIILNSPDGETTGKFPKLLRYHPDGTLQETITTQYRLPCCGGYGFDGIEFLADGSFLAHLLVSNDGPGGIYPHHWVGFKADGQPNVQFTVRVDATPGVPFTLQAATNLNAPIPWTPLLTTNVPAMPFDYVDFDVKLSEKPQKYYRVRQP